MDTHFANEIQCVNVLKHVCGDKDIYADTPFCKEIRKHLEHCTGCTNFLQSINKTIKLYQMYNPNVPADLHDKVVNALRQQKPNK